MGNAALDEAARAVGGADRVGRGRRRRDLVEATREERLVGAQAVQHPLEARVAEAAGHPS
ncbi:MAG: hypothetical protein U1F43_19730 [Myxococcota bacterium]